MFLLFLSLVNCQLHLIESEDAKCLDGSKPGYYMYPGYGSGINKWMIYHEGGGWCNSVENCFVRSKTQLGSTLYRPLELSIESLGVEFSNDTFMYNWNKVFLIYCDGGSFTGNSDAMYGITKLYFRGRQNLIAIKNSLNLKNATDVVISGCSAGGLATYLNLDWWRDSINEINKNTKVVGLPIDGFFLDLSNDHIIKDFTYYDSMKWVYENMNSSTNDKCNLGYKCMFAEHVSHYMTTPFYVLNSKYDQYDVNQVYRINEFGKLFIIKFKNIMNGSRGGFIISCMEHCSKYSYTINNINSSHAFSMFYNNLNLSVTIEDKPYPCWECCGSSITFAQFLILLIVSIFVFIIFIIICILYKMTY